MVKDKIWPIIPQSGILFLAKNFTNRYAFDKISLQNKRRVEEWIEMFSSDSWKDSSDVILNYCAEHNYGSIFVSVLSLIPFVIV